MAMNAYRQNNIVNKTKAKTVEKLSSGYKVNRAADGAADEIHSILNRLEELSVQLANGTNTEEDRSYIDAEALQLIKEMDRIDSTTTFKEQKVFLIREW